VGAEGVVGPGTRHVHDLVAVLRVRARTARQAIDLANRLVAESLAAAEIALADLTAVKVETWINQVYATGSRAAAVNLKGLFEDG
jgi:hypothetical protein